MRSQQSSLSRCFATVNVRSQHSSLSRCFATVNMRSQHSSLSRCFATVNMRSQHSSLSRCFSTLNVRSQHSRRSSSSLMRRETQPHATLSFPTAPPDSLNQFHKPSIQDLCTQTSRFRTEQRNENMLLATAPRKRQSCPLRQVRCLSAASHSEPEKFLETGDRRGVWVRGSSGRGIGDAWQPRHRNITTVAVSKHRHCLTHSHTHTHT